MQPSVECPQAQTFSWKSIPFRKQADDYRQRPTVPLRVRWYGITVHWNETGQAADGRKARTYEWRGIGQDAVNDLLPGFHLPR